MLESREEKPSPEKYRQALKYLKKRGAFRETGLKKVYCSYNSYAYKYFKEKDVKIITENKKIDTTNNTRKTKKYGGKRRLNHKKLNITLGFSKKLKLYNAKGKVKWNSSNKNIATVGKKGIIKAKKTGKVTYVVNNSSGYRLRNLDAVDCILLDSGNRFYQSKKVSFRYVPRTFKVKYKGLRKIDLRHASLNISSASYFKVYYFIN